VGSHLGAIGIPGGPDALSAQILEMMAAAALVGTAQDERVRLYRFQDASGSYVTATIEDDRLTCLTPGFMPGPTISGTCGVFNASDCRFERPLEVQASLGDVELPIPITIDDLALTEERYVRGTMITVEVSAMAERLSIFADEADYRASGAPMAVESLIPAGLFAVGVVPEATHQVTSRILLSGTLMDAELRRHGMFEHPYAVLGVKSLGGISSVAVDRVDLPGDEPSLPSIGSILSATCWISGHLAPAARDR
jgi:hypothetical protein